MRGYQLSLHVLARVPRPASLRSPLARVWLVEVVARWDEQVRPPRLNAPRADWLVRKDPQRQKEVLTGLSEPCTVRVTARLSRVGRYDGRWSTRCALQGRALD